MRSGFGVLRLRRGGYDHEKPRGCDDMRHALQTPPVDIRKRILMAFELQVWSVAMTMRSRGEVTARAMPFETTHEQNQSS